MIDGNYGSSLAARLARADLVVWLDLPTRVCLAGAVRRALAFRGVVRPDMREGCPERLDREFLKFLHYVATFRRRKRPAIERALRQSGVAVIQLTSAAERGQVVARLASSRTEMP